MKIPEILASIPTCIFYAFYFGILVWSCILAYWAFGWLGKSETWGYIGGGAAIVFWLGLFLYRDWKREVHRIRDDE